MQCTEYISTLRHFRGFEKNKNKKDKLKFKKQKAADPVYPRIIGFNYCAELAAAAAVYGVEAAAKST